MESTWEAFEAHYRKWKAYIRSDAVVLASFDEAYVANPSFQAMVDIGPDALPYLIEKLRTDEEAHFLIHVLSEITKKRFTPEEIAMAQVRYDTPLGNQHYAAMWLDWWAEHGTKNDERNVQ